MPYLCELGEGQRIYLENQGEQTIVTLISSHPGQQQQTSSGFKTGVWSSPPQAFKTPHGFVLKIISDQEENTLQIQGRHISVNSETEVVNSAEEIPVHEVSTLPVSPLPAMEPMTPMKLMEPMIPMKVNPTEPMKPLEPMNLQMGNMQMSMNPMEMRMGNMEMRMNSPSTNTAHFCTECGASIQPENRFCPSCGHRLASNQ